jgi:hypothetical protein
MAGAAACPSPGRVCRRVAIGGAAPHWLPCGILCLGFGNKRKGIVEGLREEERCRRGG